MAIGDRSECRGGGSATTSIRLFDDLYHFGHDEARYCRQAHVTMAFRAVALIEVVRVGERRIGPAGRRDPRQFHVLFAGAAGRPPCRHFVEERME